MLGITQKWLPFAGQKLPTVFKLVELRNLSGNHHNLKAFYIINSQNV